MASGFEFQSPDSRGPHFLIMLSAGRQLEKTHEKDIINASNQRNQTVIKSQDMLYYSREKSKTCFVGGSVSRAMLTYSGVREDDSGGLWGLCVYNVSRSLLGELGRSS